MADDLRCVFVVANEGVGLHRSSPIPTAHRIELLEQRNDRVDASHGDRPGVPEIRESGSS